MGIVDYVLLFAVMTAKLVGVGATLRLRPTGAVLWVRFYLAYAFLVDIAQFYSLRHFGLNSEQYSYVFWTTDISIVVLGYFILTRLAELAFARTHRQMPGLRAGALLLFSGVAVCTAAVALHLHSSFRVYWVSVSLDQNLAFLGMILTLALWFVLKKLQVPGLRFRRMVLAFGVLYSSGAVAYALMMLFPKSQLVYFAPPVCTLLALSLMVYTLMMPEKSGQPAAAQRLAIPPATREAI